MNPDLGIVAALLSEASALMGRGWHRWPEGNQAGSPVPAKDPDIMIACSGLGYENALTSARKLIAKGVKSLASIGFAGGLDPELAPGQVVLATNLLSLHNKFPEGPWSAEPGIIALAHRILTAENISVKQGRTLTTREEILTPLHKRILFKETKALTVDMESAAVAQAASEARIPFFCMRVVCDPAQTKVPEELSGCLDVSGKIQITSLLNHLVRRPSLILDLFHLTRCFHSAMPALKLAWNILMKNNLPQKIHNRDL